MKKPVVSLCAAKRIDTAPLAAALESHKKATAELATARQRVTALNTEISEFLAGTDADDVERLQTISAKQMQAQILPNLAAKVEKKLNDQLYPALLIESDKFKSALVDFYETARGELASKIAEIFQPFFSVKTVIVVGDARKFNGALTAAHQTDDVAAINRLIGMAHSVELPMQFASRERFGGYEKADQELADAASMLLTMANKEYAAKE